MPSYLRKALDAILICAYAFAVLAGLSMVGIGNGKGWLIAGVGGLALALRAAQLVLKHVMRKRALAVQDAGTEPEVVPADRRVRTIRIVLIGYTTPVVVVAIVAASVAHALPEEF